MVGFADPAYYDTEKSGLARPGSTATVSGQGGLLDAVTGTFEDLALIADGRGGVQNLIGAVQTAGTAYNTFKGKDLRSIALEEARLGAQQVLRQSLPGAMRLAMNSANGTLFPRAPTPKTPPQSGTVNN